MIYRDVLFILQPKNMAASVQWFPAALVIKHNLRRPYLIHITSDMLEMPVKS